MAQLKEKQRVKLAADTHAAYTYGEHFQSLTIDLVNMSEVKEIEAAANKAKWTTPGGFKWPAPKSPLEYRKLKNNVSEARKEELNQPYEEPNRPHVNHKQEWDENNTKSTRPEFDSIPVKGVVFGGYKKCPIVDGKKDHTLVKNPDYFKSVHLCGDGLAKVLKEAAVKEKEEWKQKVIVDNLQFQAFFAQQNPAQVLTIHLSFTHLLYS